MPKVLLFKLVRKNLTYSTIKIVVYKKIKLEQLRKEIN